MYVCSCAPDKTVKDAAERVFDAGTLSTCCLSAVLTFCLQYVSPNTLLNSAIYDVIMTWKYFPHYCLLHLTATSHNRVWTVCTHLWLLLTKRRDVLPQDLVKSRRREIECYTDDIALKFDRHLGSAAVDVSARCQSDWKSLKPSIAASRLHEILRYDARPLMVDPYQKVKV